MQLNIAVTCITFDQPLFLKAIEIILSALLNVVCRLGEFHALMSFPGSIGTGMAGSGLNVALQRCYGPNTVSHMLTGKAVTWALRGYFLIESVLNIILLEKFSFLSSDQNCQCSGILRTGDSCAVDGFQ